MARLTAELEKVRGRVEQTTHEIPSVLRYPDNFNCEAAFHNGWKAAMRLVREKLNAGKGDNPHA